MDWINDRSLFRRISSLWIRLHACQIRVVLMILYSKKPLFYNELQDKKYRFSIKSIIGHAIVGLGFGLGGLFFHSFLLTVPSSEIRIAVFWGLPCIFAMKATQVIS